MIAYLKISTGFRTRKKNYLILHTSYFSDENNGRLHELCYFYRSNYRPIKLKCLSHVIAFAIFKFYFGFYLSKFVGDSAKP